MKNAKELSDFLESLGEKVTKATKKALKNNADMLVQEIKKRCPVDTGRLRDSIHAEAKKSGMYYKIVADAKNDGIYYAKIVEFSPKINRPFMYPAMDSLRNQIKDNLIEAVRNGLKR